MHVPAFCDSCRLVFRSGIIVEDTTSNTFDETRAGPCPICDGIGHIPDGVLDFVGNTIQILSAPQRTITELSHLAKILSEARETKQSSEEVAETIKEKIPELSAMADILPRSRTDLYAFVALIASVIALLLQASQGDSGNTDVTVEHAINQVFIVTENVARQSEQRGQDKPRTGRNEPCPCGSSEKYKRCCGKLQ